MISDAKKNIITFLSDFGRRDWFVAAVKGEILKNNPDAVIVDITHELEAFSVREAAFILKNSYRSFPLKTIHLAIVDPGVGSPRYPVIVRSRGHYFVGPDNGLFSFVCNSMASVYAVRSAKPASRTFHGRDIFAPVAASLSLGVKPEALAVKITKPVRFAFPRPVRTELLIKGEVVYIDRFGDLITNIPNTAPVRRLVVKERYTAPVGKYYGQARPGTLIALRGSTGFYEVALYRGDAARKIGAGIETCVTGYL